VHDRLLALARESHRPFNELLQYFAMERFLFRMGRSRHAARFVLKGGLMLLAWRAPLSRPTKDIDVLAEHADYPGVRVRLLGFLGSARMTLQLDVGFGDVIIPGPSGLDYPTLLTDFLAPAIIGYSRESVIAEKLHAMVRLGRLNSRMNDFFDLWLLPRQFDFDGQLLADAISTTFAHRHTDVPAEPAVFETAFPTYPGKAEQWRSYLKRNSIEGALSDFADVTTYIRAFLEPITSALVRDSSFGRRWKAPGPWRRST
jgi:Nucleotidyl transferase AbiEii toxin, Type IV TA system